MCDVVCPRTILYLSCKLEEVECCRCLNVSKGLTKILHFDFPFETRWIIIVDSNVFRMKLLESDCNDLRVKFQLSSEDGITRIGSSNYLNFYIESSIEYKVPTECRCLKMRKSAKLIIKLVNNYDSCKTNKTLQPRTSKGSQKFKILLENANMSDALLVVGNKEFPVHKTILAAQSPVFYAMFNNGMKEQKENRVEIDDVDPEIMKQLLLYVYTGAIDADSVNDDQAINLLKAADKYALDDELKFICAKIISKNLTIKNVFPIISMAEQYKVNYLKKMAAYFILCNFGGIFRSTDDLDLTNSICDEKNDVTET